MNTRILSSVLIIGLVSLVIGGATLAYFSDTETSTGNTFEAGTLNLQLDMDGQIYDGENMQMFSVSDIKPGDEGEETISVHVDGGNEAWMCLWITISEDADNSCNEPEELAEGESCGTDGELDDNMDIKIWYDVGTPWWDCGMEPACTEDPEEGDNVWQEGEPILFEGKVKDLPDSNNWNHILGEGLPWMVHDEVTYMGILWSVDEGVGNEIQSDSLTVDVEFYVEQVRNNPDFTCEQ